MANTSVSAGLGREAVNAEIKKKKKIQKRASTTAVLTCRRDMITNRIRRRSAVTMVILLILLIHEPSGKSRKLLLCTCVWFNCAERESDCRQGFDH